MEKKENNYAFIDGQNLHLSTVKNSWLVDYKKFKKYLEDKYNVSHIFYFWGYYSNANIRIYKRLDDLGYVSVFKEHNNKATSNKKGNVDSNIVFEILKKLFSREKFDSIILVSGDGDFKKVVNYLIQKKRFKKVLFPSKKSVSFLYKKLNRKHIDYIEHFKKDIAL